MVEIKAYKLLQLPSTPIPNAILYVLDIAKGKVRTYITDKNGLPIPLLDEIGGGGGGTEINDLTASVTWDIVPDAFILESSVTQHQTSLLLTESQIVDLNHFTPTDLLTDYGFADNSSSWDMAYSWGDHSLAGYLTTETDPIFTASDAASITASQITNWNTAFGWGDHTGLYADINHATTHHAGGSDEITGDLLELSTAVAQFTPVDNTLGGYMEGINNELQKKVFYNTGLIQYGEIIVNNLGTDTTFDLNQGYAGFMDWDGTLNPPKTALVYFPPLSNIAVTNIASQELTFIGLSYDFNTAVVTVEQQAIPYSDKQRRTIIPLGVLAHSGNTAIEFYNRFTAPLYQTTNQLHDVINAIGSLNLEGNIYSRVGAGMQINKSAGRIFKFGVGVDFDYEQPHTLLTAERVPVVFDYRLSEGTTYASGVNVINPNVYESATGVVTAVGNNDFTIQRFYMFQSGATAIMLGQNTFATMDEAELSIATADFVVDTDIAENAIYMCYLIVRQGTTDLTDVFGSNLPYSKIVNLNKFGGTIGGGGAALTYQAIINSLGYTPENQANKVNTLGAGSTTQYPSTQAILNANYLSSSNATLQLAYDNSLSLPQITTSALGAVTVQAGVADIDAVLRGRNLAGDSTWEVLGDGSTVQEGVALFRNYIGLSTGLDGLGNEDVYGAIGSTTPSSGIMTIAGVGGITLNAPSINLTNADGFAGYDVRVGLNGQLIYTAPLSAPAAQTVNNPTDTAINFIPSDYNTIATLTLTDDYTEPTFEWRLQVENTSNQPRTLALQGYTNGAPSGVIVQYTIPKNVTNYQITGNNPSLNSFSNGDVITLRALSDGTGLSALDTTFKISQATGITSESDPIFTASPAGGITNTDIANWNNNLNPTLQDVLDNDGTATSPNGNRAINLDASNLGYAQFLMDDGTDVLHEFFSSPNNSFWTTNDYGGTGLQQGLQFNAEDFRLYRSEAGNSTSVRIDAPNSVDQRIYFTSPTGATSGTNYYVPLSVNGIFADADGEVTIPIGTSFLTATNNANKTAGSLNFQGGFLRFGSGNEMAITYDNPNNALVFDGIVGDIIRFDENGTPRITFDLPNGGVNATSFNGVAFVKDGGVATEVLRADGSVSKEGSVEDATVTGIYDLVVGDYASWELVLTGNTSFTISSEPIAGDTKTIVVAVTSQTTETLTLPVGWNIYGAFAVGERNILTIHFANHTTAGLVVDCFINQPN